MPLHFKDWLIAGLIEQLTGCFIFLVIASKITGIVISNSVFEIATYRQSSFIDQLLNELRMMKYFIFTTKLWIFIFNCIKAVRT